MRNIDKLREVLTNAVVETFGCSEDVEGTVFMICEDLEVSSCEGFPCKPDDIHYPCDECPYNGFWNKEYKEDK